MQGTTLSARAQGRVTTAHSNPVGLNVRNQKGYTLPLPALQTVDLAQTSSVSAYLKANAVVCPFVEPATTAGSLFYCEINPDCHAAADIHPRLFEQLVPIIERYRDVRRALVEKQQRLMLCHAVVIHLPAHLDADAARLLTWPNWLAWSLKQLYTPKEIVFGIVRKHIPERSSLNVPIPPAPFHAVIIRSRVVGSDQRFFTGNQPLLKAMMQADDDGLDAHAIVPGVKPDIRDPQAMRHAEYFNLVRAWGQKIVAAGRSG